MNNVLITVSTSAGLYVPQTPAVDPLPVFYAARVSCFSRPRVRFYPVGSVFKMVDMFCYGSDKECLMVVLTWFSFLVKIKCVFRILHHILLPLLLTDVLVPFPQDAGYPNICRRGSRRNNSCGKNKCAQAASVPWR